MKTAGIITEYNPLHYGHTALMQAVRRQYGAGTAIVCAMSGDFVQRGDLAVVRRQARAEAAVQSGADLVLELPLPWAVSSAEGFARGGVEVLTATGLVDVLAFGSECGDGPALLRAAQALENPEFSLLLKAELAQGDSFAATRQRAVSSLLAPADAALLSSPNNTLGIEYCRALLQTGSNAEVFTIPRTGAGHDAAVSDAGSYSASAIRTLLAEGHREEALSRMVPAMQAAYQTEEAAGRAPVFASNCERAILARLRSMSAADFDTLDTGHEGAGQRLYNASREAPSLSAILDRAKTADGAVGLSGSDTCQYPHPRPLSAGAGRQRDRPGPTGSDAENRRRAGDYKARCRPSTQPGSQALFRLEARGADLYALAYPALSAAAGGTLWRQGPAML